MRAAFTHGLIGALTAGIVVGGGQVSHAQPAPEIEPERGHPISGVDVDPRSHQVDKPKIGQHEVAWLLVSGSLAFVTIGAVLAYSANSAENDVADLYLGFGDRPPVFDARTQSTYEALLAEGHRYEVLSWASFGIAGAAAAGAAVMFFRGSGGSHPARTVRVAPIVHRGGGGVATTVRF